MAVDARLPDTARRPEPNAGFRCDVCRRFTQATEHGVCPTCGRAPLTVERIRADASASIPWSYVAGVVALLALLVFLAQ